MWPHLDELEASLLDAVHHDGADPPGRHEGELLQALHNAVHMPAIQGQPKVDLISGLKDKT